MKFRLPIIILKVGLGLGLSWGAEPVIQDSAQTSVLVCGGALMVRDRFPGDSDRIIREHFAGCRRLVLVLHATHPQDRDKMEGRLQAAFAHLGLTFAESLHRLDAVGAKASLEAADGIFVGGGETFVLLAELQQTGQLGVIQKRVRAGVPFLGVSAGANIAGMVIGTTNDFPTAEIASRSGLALLPVTINPHHPLALELGDFEGRSQKITAYLRFNPEEFVLGLGNASLVRWHHGRGALVAGSAWIYHSGRRRELTLGEAVPELVR